MHQLSVAMKRSLSDSRAAARLSRASSHRLRLFLSASQVALTLWALYEIVWVFLLQGARVL